MPSYSTRTSTPARTFSSSTFSTRPHMVPSSMMKYSRKMNRSAFSSSASSASNFASPEGR